MTMPTRKPLRMPNVLRVRSLHLYDLVLLYGRLRDLAWAGMTSAESEERDRREKIVLDEIYQRTLKTE